MGKYIMKTNYPTTEELIDTVLSTEGLMIEVDYEHHFLVLDEYPMEHGLSDRFIQFNKGTFPWQDLIVDFDGEAEKYDVYPFLKSLPPVLLMNIQAIYFVRTEDQLDSLYEEDKSPNHTFDLMHLGQHVWADGTIIISLPAHEVVCDEEAKTELEELGFSDYEAILKRAVWQTIAHELYHSLQANPIFEEEITEGEEAAEEFARSLFV